MLRSYVANWICLFGWGFHFFCLPRDKVKFQCKNETSPWPVQNSFSYILIDINGCDILKGEKITHIPSSPRRLRASWSLFFFFFLDSHLLSTYCILCVRFYLSSGLTITEAAWRAIHAHQGRLSRKRLPRATQRKALQISSCVLYILGPWESQVTKETSKSLKIKAYFYFWYLAIPAFSGLGLGGGCLSSACVRNLRFPESL